MIYTVVIWISHSLELWAEIVVSEEDVDLILPYPHFLSI
jgi:hypothetical protein